MVNLLLFLLFFLPQSLISPTVFIAASFRPSAVSGALASRCLSLLSPPSVTSSDSLCPTVASSLQFQSVFPLIPFNFLLNSSKLRFFPSRFSLQILTILLAAISSPTQPQPRPLSRPLHLSIDFISCSSISLISSIFVKIILQCISFSCRHLPLSLAESSLLSSVIALSPFPSFVFLPILFLSFLLVHGHRRSYFNLSHSSLFLFTLLLVSSFLSLFPLSRFHAISLNSSSVYPLSIHSLS